MASRRADQAVLDCLDETHARNVAFQGVESKCEVSDEHANRPAATFSQIGVEMSKVPRGYFETDWRRTEDGLPELRL